MNNTEKGPGRPKKNNDPQNTPLLFDGDKLSSALLSSAYGESESIESDLPGVFDGAVLGGDAFGLQERMRYCADLAKSSSSESVRLNAIIKYSDLEKQLKQEQTGEDLGEELSAFLAMCRDTSPGELLQEM